MKANELRIGNYVLDGTIEAAVESITKTGINFSNFYEGYLETPHENLSPIPLTEEWLMRFGFEGEVGAGGKYRYLAKHDFLFVLSGNNWGLSFGLIEVPHIQHVHQLQNLVFALTGEELTYK